LCRTRSITVFFAVFLSARNLFSIAWNYQCTQKLGKLWHEVRLAKNWTVFCDEARNRGETGAKNQVEDQFSAKESFTVYP
jgi:hypothetical protein